MSDVWWGLVEQRANVYNWSAYNDLLGKVKNAGLKFQGTISYHRCGGNVGDTCMIPLPQWVRDVGNSNPDIYYTDQHGNRDEEYLSLGVDNLPLFGGRTPVQIYSQFLKAFFNNFQNILGSTVVELQISLGPAGELRYPSYQLDKWEFPGVGEFQCYDKYMLAMLNTSSWQAGHPEWGRRGPTNAGTYNCNPCTTNGCDFFSNGFDNFGTPYGQFFLNWYSQALIKHGNDILAPMATLARGTGVELAGKVSGIHWQFNTPAHGAEQTAGYKNDKGTAYAPIAQMFKRNGVAFDFTCFEMRDSEQPGYACSNPQTLVRQTIDSVRATGGHYDGENALPRYDNTAYGTIIENSRQGPGTIKAFTYLRLDGNLLSGQNWENFKGFVRGMASLP